MVPVPIPAFTGVEVGRVVKGTAIKSAAAVRKISGCEVLATRTMTGAKA
jgi:hypothetical protein